MIIRSDDCVGLKRTMCKSNLSGGEHTAYLIFIVHVNALFRLLMHLMGAHTLQLRERFSSVVVFSYVFRCCMLCSNAAFKMIMM